MASSVCVVRKRTEDQQGRTRTGWPRREDEGRSEGRRAGGQEGRRDGEGDERYCVTAEMQRERKGKISRGRGTEKNRKGPLGTWKQKMIRSVGKGGKGGKTSCFVT